MGLPVLVRPASAQDCVADIAPYGLALRLARIPPACLVCAELRRTGLHCGGCTMTQLSLGEAAKICGRNRTTIFRAMKSGRLSFSVNGAGERQVDLAELERVFPTATTERNSSNATHAALLAAQLEGERGKIALLERTNDELRQRLEASETERRTVQAQLNATIDRMAALLPAPGKTAPDQPRPLGRRILAWAGQAAPVTGAVFIYGSRTQGVDIVGVS